MATIVTHFHKRRVRLLTILLLVSFISFLIISGSAQAQGINYGAQVPAGTTLDRDVILNGDDVVLNGTVTGDVFAVGRTVTINGTVGGSLFVIAERVDVNGEVAGSAYSAAVNENLGQESSIGRTLYFVGARLSTEQESVIGQDLHVVSLALEQKGSVERDQTAVVGLIEIIRRISNAVGGPDINLFSAADPGKQSVFTAAGLDGRQVPKFARLAAPSRSNLDLAASQVEDQAVKPDPTGQWFLDRLKELVSFLIVGGLLARIFPVYLSLWSEKARSRPWASAGLGFVALITGYVGVGLLALMILAIGLGLVLISLWELGWLAWGLGLSGLGLAFFTFLLFILFISKVIVSYLSGKLILDRFFPRAAQHTIWPLLLGLLIYVLLRSIPIFGWVLSIIVTIIGLGAVWLVYSDKSELVADILSEEE